MAGQKKAAKSNAQKRRSMTASRSQPSQSELSKSSQDELRQSLDTVKLSNGSMSASGAVGGEAEASAASVGADEGISRRASLEPIVYHSKSHQRKPSLDTPKIDKKEEKGEVASDQSKKGNEPAKTQEHEVLKRVEEKIAPATTEEKKEEPKLAEASHSETPQQVLESNQGAPRTKTPPESKQEAATIKPPSPESREPAKKEETAPAPTADQCESSIFPRPVEEPRKAEPVEAALAENSVQQQEPAPTASTLVRPMTPTEATMAAKKSVTCGCSIQ